MSNIDATTMQMAATSPSSTCCCLGRAPLCARVKDGRRASSGRRGRPWPGVPLPPRGASPVCRRCPDRVGRDGGGVRAACHRPGRRPEPVLGPHELAHGRFRSCPFDHLGELSKTRPPRSGSCPLRESPDRDLVDCGVDPPNEPAPGHSLLDSQIDPVPKRFEPLGELDDPARRGCVLGAWHLGPWVRSVVVLPSVARSRLRLPEQGLRVAARALGRGVHGPFTSIGSTVAPAGHGPASVPSCRGYWVRATAAIGKDSNKDPHPGAGARLRFMPVADWPVPVIANARLDRTCPCAVLGTRRPACGRH